MDKGRRHRFSVEFFKDSEHECRFKGAWKRDRRHGLSLLVNGNFFECMLRKYKSGEPFGLQICWGVRDTAATLSD